MDWRTFTPTFKKQFGIDPAGFPKAHELVKKGVPQEPCRRRILPEEFIGIEFREMLDKAGPRQLKFSGIQAQGLQITTKLRPEVSLHDRRFRPPCRPKGQDLGKTEDSKQSSEGPATKEGAECCLERLDDHEVLSWAWHKAERARFRRLRLHGCRIEFQDG